MKGDDGYEDRKQEGRACSMWQTETRLVRIAGKPPFPEAPFGHMVCKGACPEARDGDKAADIVANAPATEENFFLVPKVVE